MSNFGRGRYTFGSSQYYSEVDTYADLPNASGYAGHVYLVLSGSWSGVWYYRAGLYHSDGTTWTRLANLTVISDEIFTLVDDSTNTKKAMFECSTISAATTRTFTFPDQTGTLALTSDLTAGTLDWYTTGSGRFDGGVGIGVDPTAAYMFYIQSTRNPYVAMRITNTTLNMDVQTVYETSGSVWSTGIDDSINKFVIARYGDFSSNVNLTIDSSDNFDFQGGDITTTGTGTFGSLKVNEGSVWFDGTTGTAPASGAGTRFMWIPAKGALRAGIVTGTDWDNSNIGTYTVSFGADNDTNGTYNYTFGYGCDTSNPASQYNLLCGSSLSSDENYCYLFGSTLSSANIYSFISGLSITSGGDYQICFGRNFTPLASDDSFCLGWGQLDYSFTATAANFYNSSITTTSTITAAEITLTDLDDGSIPYSSSGTLTDTANLTWTPGTSTFSTGSIDMTGSLELGANATITLPRTSDYGYILGHSGSATADGARGSFYPQNANSGITFYLIPKGTSGWNSQSLVGIFNTDFVADSTNYERLLLGAYKTYYTIDVAKGGTGSLRPLYFQMDGATKLTLATDGLWNFGSNVGIGKTPTVEFDVAGQAIITSTSDPQLKLIHTAGVDEADFYVTDAGDLHITPTGTLYLESDTEVVKTGGAGTNCFSTLIGNVAAADHYVSWQVDDGDDRLELTRDNAAITGYWINMPLEVELGVAGAAPTLTLDQNDEDQAFINYEGAEAADNSKNVSTGAPTATTTKYIRVELAGVEYWMKAVTWA